MTVDLVERITTAFAEGLHVQEYGSEGAHLVYTPLALEGGRTVTIYVEPVGDGIFALSDRGQVTGELAIAGLDLAKHKTAGQSWEAIKRSLELPPALGEWSDYELTAMASSENLGRAVVSLAEAAVRAEGLKALTRHGARRTFRDVVISSADAHGLAVVPRASLPTRHGGQREVTCRIEARTGIYMQALSAGQGMEGYDHVRSVFGDSEISPSQKVTAIQERARLSNWQVESLRDVSLVVEEHALGEYYEGLKAA